MPDAPQNPPPTPYGGQQYPGGYYPPPAYSQPPKKRKVWPWVLGAVLGVFILFFGGCVAFLAVVGKSLETSKPTVSSNGGTSQPSRDRGADFPGKQKNDTGANAGDSVTVDNVTFTSVSLRRATGQYGNTTYLCTEVTIKNRSNKPARFSDVWDWKLQNPSGTIRDATLLGTETKLASGEVASGGSTTGDVCFENQADPGTYVVLLDPTIRLSTDRIGWINHL
jgi:Domain of unknown function (DUF4352)